MNHTSDQTTDLKNLQMAQNRLLRALNKSKSDKISTKSLLTKFNLLSVNQLAAQIKLQETWKSINIQKYPELFQQKRVSKNLLLHCPFKYKLI